MRFVRRVSAYTIKDHVSITIIRNALQIYVSEERIHDYKNKWHNHILVMDSSRLTQKFKNYQPDGRISAEDREDDGRIVSKTEQANKSVT
jgi:hypothetical protein